MRRRRLSSAQTLANHRKNADEVHVGRRVALMLLALTALAAPAVAHARVIIGIGDQKPDMYSDPRLYWLGINHTRIIVSWEVERVRWERQWVDSWLNDARFAGVEPLVGFGHSWSNARRHKLPSVAQYRKAVSDFHARYPWVHDYIAWNEANHCSQPTCHHPARAAAYFDTLVDTCPTCDVVAGDVLDQDNMVSWLRTFRRAAHHQPKIWGLHNYVDVNRLRSTGTRHLLDAVKGGQVWITETGGVVHRKHYRGRIPFVESASHAGTVTSYALKLAVDHPEITRVYLYHWSSDSSNALWDSGLIGPRGHLRPGFLALARFLGRDPRKAPPRPQPGHDPAPAAPPPSDQTPQSSGQPPPESGGQTSPSQPAPPQCFVLPPLC
jgi:hypothetical protein